VVDKIVSANAELKSAGKAQRMLKKLAELPISDPQIMTLSGEIGEELREDIQRRADLHAANKLAPDHAEPPGLAVVATDGGRIMTRAEGGRGVHDCAWKETKNACLMTMSSSVSEDDPHPELPACFTNRTYVEKLVREIHSTPSASPKNADFPGNSGISAETAIAAAPDESSDTGSSESCAEKRWQPERLVRTCVSSMATSERFGPLVAGEAQRRGFYRAARRAFLGDGQAWNWTLQESHFPDFTPITDFVHPMGYVYEAAKILSPSDTWSVYLRGAAACWKGRVTDFLAELYRWQAAHPRPANEESSNEELATEDQTDVKSSDAETSNEGFAVEGRTNEGSSTAALTNETPWSVIQRAVTYLENNRPRMDYPAYRRRGLPVSTSMIESLIKEVNYRVKGTEKFWNRPAGAERILQVRAAVLCDDDRLSRWILTRPGGYFYRPTSRPASSMALPA